MTLDVQFITMITMIVSGIYLGIARETFRRFQPHWKSNRFLLYFMEISFWLCQVTIIFYILFLVNAGELRVYILLALLLGISAYHVLVAPIYKHVLDTGIRMGAAIYSFLKKVIYTLMLAPAKFMIQLLVTIVVFMFRLMISVLSFLAIVFFTPLKWITLGIYRLLPKKIQYFLHKTAGFYSTIKNICKKGWKYLTRRRR